MRALDLIDVTILRSLLADGRKSFAELAEDCGISKNIVWKRFNSLSRSGVIAGYTIQVDQRYLGLQVQGSTILAFIRSNQVDQTVERIRSFQHLLAYRIYNIPYNLRVVVFPKSLAELDQIKEEMRRRYPVLVMRTFIWTDNLNIPEHLTMGFQLPPDLKNIDYGADAKNGGAQVESLDDLDLRIVQELTEDSRISFRKLSARLNVSTLTAERRYEKLRAKHILKPVARVDLVKLGYNAIVDFNVEYDSEREQKRGIHTLAAIPDVTCIVKTTGDFDLQVTVMLRGLEHLLRVQEQIEQTPCIGRVEAPTRKAFVWPGKAQSLSTIRL
jgi:DNA-binding Lrp family transcriptional regulator